MRFHEPMHQSTVTLSKFQFNAVNPSVLCPNHEHTMLFLKFKITFISKFMNDLPDW